MQSSTIPHDLGLSGRSEQFAENIEFSAEQQHAFELYKQGKNVFITGPGGTGKSALIRKIYQDAADTYGMQHVQVTALTGAAAVLLNGCRARTLHSWACIGLAAGEKSEIVRRVSKNQYAKAAWRAVQVLIIDEVSMMSKKLFEVLDSIGRFIRMGWKRSTVGDGRGGGDIAANLPFGGIQLIFSGDFYQLPPVGSRGVTETQQFCFESASWLQTFPAKQHVLLHRVFRQADAVYADILKQIRVGEITRKSCRVLESRVGCEAEMDALPSKPIKLFPTKARVAEINDTHLAKLPGEAHSYTLKRMPNIGIEKEEDRVTRQQFTARDVELEMDFLENNVRCEATLTLKVGTRVMCTVNLPAAAPMLDANGESVSLCNGSQGVVEDFCSATHYPLVAFDNGIKRVMMPHLWESDIIPGVGVTQVPLILAWAVSIHKAQGMTLAAAEVSAGSDIFECGQVYVVLSRVKSLQGLFLKSFDPLRIRVSRKVKQFYRDIEALQADEELKERSVTPPLRLIPEVVGERVVEDKGDGVREGVRDIPVAVAVAVPCEVGELAEVRMIRY